MSQVITGTSGAAEVFAISGGCGEEFGGDDSELCEAWAVEVVLVLKEVAGALALVAFKMYLSDLSPKGTPSASGALVAVRGRDEAMATDVPR